jgi:hypothetical protein
MTWLSDNLLTLGAYALAVIVWLVRGQHDTGDNTKAIGRLEAAVQKLVDKLDILIDRDADMRERMADHAARITNLESRL